jgi:ABC transporter substrate binding protein
MPAGHALTGPARYLKETRLRSAFGHGSSESRGNLKNPSILLRLSPDPDYLAGRLFVLPAVYPYRFYTAAGGLISYSVDPNDEFRRSADYVDRILKHAKPADLPVQLAAKFELTVNLKTAKALGITIPPSLLDNADEVIE